MKEFGESIQTMHILFRETACVYFHEVGKQGNTVELSRTTLIFTYNVP